MAKRRKRRTWPFLLFMVIYAAAFLYATGYGLGKFTGFLDAYERSRPQNTINTYMDSLTAEHIVDKSQALMDQIDHYLQSEEECKEVLRGALTGSFSYAKKIADCTEDKQVFVIRCGARVIGTMSMERQPEIGYGFTPWSVTEDSFDLSYLISNTVSARVPQSYTVLVNGRVLTADYETEHDIPYPQLSDYYGSYALGYMVSYEAGPVLGDIGMKILDEAGNPGTADLDPVEYLKNIPEERVAELDSLIHSYLEAYMNFSTRKGNDSYRNYNALAKFMVKDGDLAKRMYNAINGLIWVTDRSAVLDGYETALLTDLDGTHYLADVSYTVTLNDYAGSMTATNRVNLIIIPTGDGLRVEAMRSF